MNANTQWAVAWMNECHTVVTEKREELIALDRAIGDADHGENLDRGFAAVCEQINANTYDTPGAVLKAASMALMSNVGGAYGPLCGTAFLRIATTSGFKEVLSAEDIAAVLAAAAEGIKARGKSKQGEKTMVDAWVPAAKAAKEAAEAGKDAIATMRAAADAAQTGAEITDQLKATKGRASYLGERSVGHRDPGAQSTAYILDAAARMLESEAA